MDKIDQKFGEVGVMLTIVLGTICTAIGFCGWVALCVVWPYALAFPFIVLAAIIRHAMSDDQ